jgi:hypothetical protein
MPVAKGIKDKRKARNRNSTNNNNSKQSNSVTDIGGTVQVITHDGNDAITLDYAKGLLGWEEETDKQKFGDDYLFKTSDGRKVRCTRNRSNRPLSRAVYETLKQEILRGRWQLNGESIIIGNRGAILNGQHRLIGFVLAVLQWITEPQQYPCHATQPTLPTIVVYNIVEDDAVVNTLDTCKPRTLSDVLYRTAYFGSLATRPRRLACRIADYAVRLLWHRTGAVADAFGLRRTHAESLDFILRHPRLVECVQHIYEEDESGRISRCVSAGYAAGLMYLMGASATVAATYHQADPPSEHDIQWEHWPHAQNFWVQLANGDKRLAAVRKYLNTLIDDEHGCTNAERWAVLIRAWLLYLQNQPITTTRLALDYVTTKDGARVLDSHPLVGGIDVGDVGVTVPTNTDPTEEQIAARSAKYGKQPIPAKRVAKRTGDQWAAGDSAWITDDSSDSFFGVLTCDPYECDDTIHRVMVSADDGEWEVESAQLQLTP